jgi:hypothetical protein
LTVYSNDANAIWIFRRRTARSLPTREIQFDRFRDGIIYTPEQVAVRYQETYRRFLDVVPANALIVLFREPTTPYSEAPSDRDLTAALRLDCVARLSDGVVYRVIK